MNRLIKTKGKIGFHGGKVAIVASTTRSRLFPVGKKPWRKTGSANGP
jgi:hypothetical protein